MQASRHATETDPMDFMTAFIAIAAVITMLGVLGLTALQWGSDSRDLAIDDHHC
jgi:hypothetical protein